ncbi:MAG: hypothetical protein B7Y76_02535 [Sphingobacteriia bacterium 35-40-5]|nr:MAG: hypothetical protein B7Y76_02535 [Sphingobacteriia bacterium 35-40-5]
MAACGLDFGTSNTTLGLPGPAGPVLAALEGDKTTVPSAVFYDRTGIARIGRDAVRAYVEGEDGRLMRALKSVLGTALIDETTSVGRRRIPFREVIGDFVTTVKSRAEADRGVALTQVVMGRPVFFVDDDAAGNANATPNGFYGENACQIARYAGMNDKLSSIGFYEYNPAYDLNGQTAMLLAQMVWYFVDGFYNRKKEFPLLPKSQYITYRAGLKDGSHELIFVKSKKSDRWWMQVPYPAGKSKNERHHLVPCRYEDYQTANSGEMPDLWWRTYQKLI